MSRLAALKAITITVVGPAVFFGWVWVGYVLSNGALWGVTITIAPIYCGVVFLVYLKLKD